MRAYCPAVLAALAISGGSCAVGRGAAVGGASARVRAPLLAPRPLTMLGEPEPKPGAGGGARRAQGARTSSADEYAGSNSDSEGDRRALLAADDPSACPRSWRDAALLPALLGVYVHNQWSRSLLFYLVDFGARESGGSGARATRELMNVELGFGPETYGVLASLPFTLVFAPASLLAGTAADRLDRARLTWVSLLCWSAATLWQGAAQSVGEVAASRALQGLAQAVTTPAAFTLIADVTPAARRGTANSIFASGVYVGGGLAALSILLDEALGWRGTLYAAAALGALLAAGAALTLDDPREREPQGSAARTEAPADAASASVEGDAFRGARTLMAEQIASLGRTAAAVSQRPAVQLLLFSCALRFCAGFSIAVWVGPWGRGAFPEHEADFALAKASISAFGGGFSVRARRADLRCAPLRTAPACGAARPACAQPALLPPLAGDRRWRAFRQAWRARRGPQAVAADRWLGGRSRVLVGHARRAKFRCGDALAAAAVPVR